MARNPADTTAAAEANEVIIRMAEVRKLTPLPGR
jgi:hypothetical protein